MKHHYKLIPLIFFLVVTSSGTWALVDYSEQEAPMVNSAVKKNRVVGAKSIRRVGARRQGGGASLIDSFSFRTGIESMKVNYEGHSRKVTRFIGNSHIQTNYNVFTNINYWYASSDSDSLASTSRTQAGNPTVRLGFNWLKFGKAEEMATIDLYGGAMFKATDSEFGSSRFDKLAGVETSKRFFDLALALGWELRITGSPSNPDESAIGNINKLSAAIGWRVSPDINFSVEGVNYKVSGNKGTEYDSIMTRGFSFSYISPKMNLKIGTFIGLEMGAIFRTDKVEISEEIVGAKLWDLEGLYGNSIFGGLNLTI